MHIFAVVLQCICSDVISGTFTSPQLMSAWAFIAGFCAYAIGSKIAVSHAINSHVLTDKHPCISQAINVLLMYGYTHSMRSQKLTTSTVTCIEMDVI